MAQSSIKQLGYTAFPATFDEPDIRDSNRGDKIVLTFVNRVGTRRLLDQDLYLEEIRARLPRVELCVVDLAELPFKEQIQVVRDSDILLGVHGAGLTHSFWLPAGSATVEILPKGLNHKGFRNIAGLLGHVYMSAHATERESVKRRRDAWHHDDVYIEKERFIELVELAVKSVNNTGTPDLDIK